MRCLVPLSTGPSKLSLKTSHNVLSDASNLHLLDRKDHRFRTVSHGLCNYIHVHIGRDMRVMTPTYVYSSCHDVHTCYSLPRREGNDGITYAFTATSIGDISAT